MSRLTLRRKGAIRAAAVSAAGLLGVALPISAFGQSLQISLGVPSSEYNAAQASAGLVGSGTIFATPWVGTDAPVPVTINVYGTITGGTLGASDFDGIQYAYYNINAIGSNEHPTTLGGTITNAAVVDSTTADNFNGGDEAGNSGPVVAGNGVQIGNLTNATPAGAGSPGVAVGSTSNATLIAKPRAAGIVWNNSSAGAGDITTTSNSTTFLLETIQYTPPNISNVLAAGATSTRTGGPVSGTTTVVQSNLSVSIPTSVLTGADLVAANWWADSSTASSTPTGFQNGSGTGTYSASSNVVTITDALPGDCNLDGAVNISDFNILQSHFNEPQSSNGGQPFTWAQGDFNGDGNVNISDFNIMGTEFNQGAAGTGPLDGDAGPLEQFAIENNDVAGFEAATGLTIAVPEPASLGLLAVGGIALLGRRRRASS